MRALNNTTQQFNYGYVVWFMNGDQLLPLAAPNIDHLPAGAIQAVPFQDNRHNPIKDSRHSREQQQQHYTTIIDQQLAG